MTEDQRTIPHAVQGRPVRALKLEVTGGPDRGVTWTGSSDSVTIGTAKDNDLCLTDETVSRYHVELRTEGDRIHVKDHGSTNGTMVGPAQIIEGTVSQGAELKLGQSSVRVLDGDPVHLPLHRNNHLHGIYGRSVVIRRLMARVEQVAKADVSVLLLGETGTGKEVVARAIHEASKRAQQPFEIVDCGALMPTLIASELFGHEKGAFTGANAQYVGAFERANGGTIFLDEIGELPAELQVRLLGVLERRTFRRLGGTKRIAVDVRVVSATHRDIRAWVNSGEFRQDLYYRIAVAHLKLPPLRERAEDIPVLIEHFLKQMDIEEPIDSLIPEQTIERFKRYHWPGNIRELRNLVEATLAFGGSDLDALGLETQTHVSGAGAASGSMERAFELPYREARDLVVRDFQRVYLKRALESAGGNVSKAAERAQMNRPHLVQLLKRLGLR